METKKKSWQELKNVIEFSKKNLVSSNNCVPSNLSFRHFKNSETGQDETRIYFLASTQKSEITIKYVTIAPNLKEDTLIGCQMFSNNLTNEKQNLQLTKEEQLLRERKRCSFTGITSFSIDPKTGRVVFSERSDLFYFDDEISSTKNDFPIEIGTKFKGAIDIQICPSNPNIISYILNDNLWIQNLETNEEIQLTFTFDSTKSGAPSYVVQEEFNRYTGYWWQPNSQLNIDGSQTYRIVYEEIDDSDVDSIYITPSCVNEFGYDSYRYPKAGTTNSKIYLKMIEINFDIDNKLKSVVQKRMSKSFYELFDWYEYLVRADWHPNGKFFWAQIYDRLQYHSATLLIPLDYFVEENDKITEIDMILSTDEDIHKKNIYLLYEQTSNAWINVHNSMYFLNDEDKNSLSFLTALDETGFLHLYSYKLSLDFDNLIKLENGVLKVTKSIRNQLTNGDWTIEFDTPISVDQKNHLVYFTGYQNPLESHLFVVNYKNPTKIKQLTNSGYSHTVTINEESNMFISVCSNLETPSKAFIYKIENQHNGIDNINVKQIAQLLGREQAQNNQNTDIGTQLMTFCSLLNLNAENLLTTGPIDNESLSAYFFKPPQIFSFLTDDNCKLYGMIYHPYNYKEGTKYPTLLYIYGGPKVQIVNNSFKANKFSRLNILTLLGYCVVVVDSRGSNNRGLKFEAHLNKKMGTVEINDQVKGLEEASNIFKCIDMKRVAIYGWSYGGYMSLMGLAQRPDIFKVAISGAPVTSWELYDTGYTERYMGLPSQNQDAYNNGSVIKCAKAFPDEENRLLIIHGMIDENVHFVHTRKLIDALIKENKPYQLQIYPKERHGIRSQEASIHCDLNFYSFLERNL